MSAITLDLFQPDKPAPTEGRSCPLSVASGSAILSPCGRYRYELWRNFASGPTVAFVGLNPSTADATTDDPTIRRCVAYAKRWGYGSLCMVNLFAWRATDPRDMKAAADPIGPDNDATLRRLYATVGVLIAAWGNDGGHMNRAAVVMEMLPKLHCLKRNKDGSPAHPLYLRGDATPFLLNLLLGGSADHEKKLYEH